MHCPSIGSGHARSSALQGAVGSSSNLEYLTAPFNPQPCDLPLLRLPSWTGNDLTVAQSIASTLFVNPNITAENIARAQLTYSQSNITASVSVWGEGAPVLTALLC